MTPTEPFAAVSTPDAPTKKGFWDHVYEFFMGPRWEPGKGVPLPGVERQDPKDLTEAMRLVAEDLQQGSGWRRGTDEQGDALYTKGALKVRSIGRGGAVRVYKVETGRATYDGEALGALTGAFTAALRTQEAAHIAVLERSEVDGILKALRKTT